MKCQTCGNTATCYGSYETHDAWAPACDDCCGHGNEDGVCGQLPPLPFLNDELLHWLAAGHLGHEGLARADVPLHYLQALLRECLEGRRKKETA